MKKAIKFIIPISLIILVIILIVFSNKTKEKTINYDVSSFHEVDIYDAVDLFESKKEYVLFIGYDKCEVCANIIPYLKEVQINNNYITQYLDITKVDRYSSIWEEFISYLTMKSTQYLNETDTGEKETNTYGYFLDQYGFTPTLIIIKDGKQTGGSIGGYDDYNEFTDWLESKI